VTGTWLVLKSGHFGLYQVYNYTLRLISLAQIHPNGCYTCNKRGINKKNIKYLVLNSRKDRTWKDTKIAVSPVKITTKTDKREGQKKKKGKVKKDGRLREKR
jgi:hypothetical protein